MLKKVFRRHNGSVKLLFAPNSLESFYVPMGKVKQSAGLLMFRLEGGSSIEVLIAHPGGPIFENRDEGYWGLPKGEFEAGETAVEAACREFEEETGMTPQGENYLDLGHVVQKGGKTVYAWAFEGDWPEDQVLCSNMIHLEWPRGSGKWHDIPEVDKVKMVGVSEAQRLMKAEQFEFVERLVKILTTQQKLDLGLSKS